MLRKFCWKVFVDKYREVFYNCLCCSRWVNYPGLRTDAEVAELADAHGSGPCGRNTLWVRLPSSAVRLGAGNLDFIRFPAAFIYRNRWYVRYDLQSQCFFDSQRLFFLRFPFKVVESVRRTDIAVSCESLNCAVIHIRIIQKR